MTIDHETAELLRDEPELLAIADALQSAGDRIDVPAPRRARSYRPRLVAIALAAAAAVALLLASPWDTGSGPSFVEKALAAVGDGPVEHVVVRYTIGERVELGTGHSAPLHRDAEVWYDAERHVYRSIARLDGHVVFQASGTGDLANEPFLLTTLFRKALEEGKLRKTGEADVRGHHAILVEAAEPHGDVVMRAALDAESFRLLWMQYFKGGRLQGQIDVLLFETVSRDQAHLPNPQAGAVPQPGVSRSGGLSYGDNSISTEEARKAFAEPAPWPGPSVGGHPLSAIRVEDATDTTGGETVRGRKLGFEYGSEPGSEPYLAVEEAPATSPLWAAESVYTPPAGYVDLTTGQASTDGHRERTQWTGVMQQDGFVLQLTSWSRATLLAAARALRPLP